MSHCRESQTGANSCEGDKGGICPVAPVVPSGAVEPGKCAPRLRGYLLDTVRTAICEILQVGPRHTPCFTSGAGKHLTLPSTWPGWSTWIVNHRRLPNLLLGGTWMYIFFVLAKKTRAWILPKLQGNVFSQAKNKLKFSLLLLCKDDLGPTLWYRFYEFCSFQSL